MLIVLCLVVGGCSRPQYPAYTEPVDCNKAYEILCDQKYVDGDVIPDRKWKYLGCVFNEGDVVGSDYMNEWCKVRSVE